MISTFCTNDDKISTDNFINSNYEFKIIYKNRRELLDFHWNSEDIKDDSNILLLVNIQESTNNTQKVWQKSSEWTQEMWIQFNIKYPSFDTNKYNLIHYCTFSCEYECMVCNEDIATSYESCQNCYQPDRLHQKKTDKFNRLNSTNNISITSCINKDIYEGTLCIPCSSSKFTNLAEGNYFDCPLNCGLEMQFIIQIANRLFDNKYNTYICCYYFDIHGNLVPSNMWSHDVWKLFKEKHNSIYSTKINLDDLCVSCNCLKNSKNDLCIICDI